MKGAWQTLVLSVFVVTGAASTASAQAMHGTKIILAQEIKWGPAPASIPPGAEAATLYGDPSKEGLFALRLKVPKGYHIPPHTHPKTGGCHGHFRDVPFRDRRNGRSGSGSGASGRQRLRLFTGYGALCLRRRGHGHSAQQQRAVGNHLCQPEGRPAPEAVAGSGVRATLLIGHVAGMPHARQSDESSEANRFHSGGNHENCISEYSHVALEPLAAGPRGRHSGCVLASCGREWGHQ